jgi:hypothetical protein
MKAIRPVSASHSATSNHRPDSPSQSGGSTQRFGQRNAPAANSLSNSRRSWTAAPSCDRAVERVRSFAGMMTHLRDEQLIAWITADEEATLPDIGRFTTGLTAGLAAVIARLSCSATVATSASGTRIPAG